MGGAARRFRWTVGYQTFLSVMPGGLGLAAFRWQGGSPAPGGVNLGSMRIDPSWTGGIGALVSEANEWLEELLPADRSGRSKAGVNPRLVRHYTTERLLSAPVRVGREARYTRRHLLEVLALRRLMADGISGRALALALENRSEAALLELAERGSLALESVQLQEEDEVALARQAALDYIGSLQKVSRARQSGEAAGAQQLQMLRNQAAPEDTADLWRTQQVWQAAPGLTLTLAADAQLPSDEAGWHQLIEAIEAALRSSSL